ncbi:terpene synthase family protein [Algoriphagus aquimarinus]|uniref:Terpene synthase n=1 Tax=Algoriphagus aquimarinus TaxID=237018 RepID=A0A1I1APE6_9BACT|nr:hypothetical protein [Algoriphagus aquimarinus]SFB39837.1 hypothetical protein SAMN04489723_10915 [Algoriphagus aquimarinus]
MKTYALPVSLNIHTPGINALVMDWAVKTTLLTDEAEISLVEKQRINWFAGYLFPEMDEITLESVMKFFFCLFRMDDLLDHTSFPVSKEFLDTLLDQGRRHTVSQNSPYYTLVNELEKVLYGMIGLGDGIWQNTFLSFWREYVDAQSWELHNRENKLIPDLKEYQISRLDSSGVYLALHLLKREWKYIPCSIAIAEQKIARIICLSNDIKSMEKEKNAKDFHNELLLLKYHTGCSELKIKEYLRTQLNTLIGQLEFLLFSKKQDEMYSMAWSRQLMLLLGGCLYWSEEGTPRYATVINGVVKE